MDALDFCALPVVDLQRVGTPRDGTFIPAPPECAPNMAKGSKCRAHYEAVAKAEEGEAVVCPYGFTSARVAVGPHELALTGVVPGSGDRTPKQNRAAKRNPSSRVGPDTLGRAGESLRVAQARLDTADDEAARNYSKALHEIRKYNRTVRHAAERLLLRDGETRLGDVGRELRNIEVAADLMSRQFDIIQALAQDELLTRPLDSRGNLKGFVTKILHVLREAHPERKIYLNSDPSDYDPTIAVSDFSFPILVSVLLDNALKYSLRGTYVEVRVVRVSRSEVRLEVLNLTRAGVLLTADVFRRGYRGSVKADGAGIGLYVASIVAQQHGSELRVQTERRSGRNRQVFSLTFRVL